MSSLLEQAAANRQGEKARAVREEGEKARWRVLRNDYIQILNARGFLRPGEPVDVSIPLAGQKDPVQVTVRSQNLDPERTGGFIEVRVHGLREALRISDTGKATMHGYMTVAARGEGTRQEVSSTSPRPASFEIKGSHERGDQKSDYEQYRDLASVIRRQLGTPPVR